MKRTLRSLAAALTLAVLCAGCAAKPSDPVDPPTEQNEPAEAIPFAENQLYAVAFLGYEGTPDVSPYTSYLEDDRLPIHYLAGGEYYLVIPRYPDMALQISKNDIETDTSTLLYEDSAARPFIIQCNISDIFADAAISLTYNGETVTFSPLISLMDGSVQVGERGLNLTK